MHKTEEGWWQKLPAWMWSIHSYLHQWIQISEIQHMRESIKWWCITNHCCNCNLFLSYKSIDQIRKARIILQNKHQRSIYIFYTTKFWINPYFLFFCPFRFYVKQIVSTLESDTYGIELSGPMHQLQYVYPHS